MREHTWAVKSVAILAPCVRAFELAVLLGEDIEDFGYRAYDGKIPGAVQGFSEGFCFDARRADEMLVERYSHPDELREARYNLLDLRSGRKIVKDGQLVEPVSNETPRRGSAADLFLDDELVQLLSCAYDALGSSIAYPSEFDHWADINASGVTSTDVALRLGAVSWDSLMDEMWPDLPFPEDV